MAYLGYMKVYTRYRRFWWTLFLPGLMAPLLNARLSPLLIGLAALLTGVSSFLFIHVLNKNGKRVNGKITLEKLESEDDPSVIVQFSPNSGTLIQTQPAVSSNSLSLLHSNKQWETTDTDVEVIFFPPYPEAFIVAPHEIRIKSVAAIFVVIAIFLLGVSIYF